MGLAFVPTADVIKGYTSIINDFDVEDNNLLDYFDRVWVGQKKGRGVPITISLFYVFNTV